MEIDRLFHRSRRERSRGGGGMGQESRGSHGAPRGPDRRGSSTHTMHSGNTKTADSKAQTEEKRQSGSLEANGVPMKMLIKAEMSKEGKVKPNSPCLIARLMGLDTLPSSAAVHKSGGCLQKPLNEHTGGLRDLEPECKDVFEVLEEARISKLNIPHTDRTLPKSRNCELKEFTDQKLLRTRYHFAHENTRKFMELHDGKEILGRNGDFQLRMLQESNKVLAKDSVDFDSVLSTSSDPSRITVLQSSNPRNFKIGEANRKCKRCNGTRRTANRHTTTDQSANVSPKLAKTGQKSDPSSLPTRIIVLKPNLRKTHGGNDSFPFQYSMENFHPGHRRHKSSGSCKFLSENRNHESLFTKTEVPRSKIQNSGGTFMEIGKTRRKYNADDFYEGQHNISLAKSICRRQSKTNLENKDISSTNLYQLCESKSSSYLKLSSHSMESFVSREARRHLSKQWSMSNSYKDVRYVDQGPSTLAEMLAISDGETPVNDSLDLHRIVDCPLGGGSRDGWKDPCPRKLARSRSLPSSSTFLVNLSSAQDDSMLKDVPSYSIGSSFEESDFHEKLYSFSGNEDMHISTIPSDDCTGKGTPPPPCGVATSSGEIYVTENSVSVSEPPLSFYDAVSSAEEIPASATAKGSTTESNNFEWLHDAIILESSVDTPGTENEGVLQSKILLDELNEVYSSDESSTSMANYPEAPKDEEQPSPVSVLDTVDEEDQSRPGCFERVNADIQSLRLQLQLLRSESASTCTEGSEILSDEETHETYDELEDVQYIPQHLTCDEDQDFSYVQRILKESGLEGTSMDEVLDTCHLPELPINPILFAKLEKHETSVWLRGERKLLFDIVNCVLAELLAPRVRLSSWAHPGRISHAISNQKLLAEDVWTCLVERRLVSTCKLEESSLDAGWLNFADDIGAISRDLEGMLGDDLLNEMVSELTFQK